MYDFCFRIVATFRILMTVASTGAVEPAGDITLWIATSFVTLQLGHGGWIFLHCSLPAGIIWRVSSVQANYGNSSNSVCYFIWGLPWRFSYRLTKSYKQHETVFFHCYFLFTNAAVCRNTVKHFIEPLTLQSSSVHMKIYFISTILRSLYIYIWLL